MADASTAAPVAGAKTGERRRERGPRRARGDAAPAAAGATAGPAAAGRGRRRAPAASRPKDGEDAEARTDGVVRVGGATPVPKLAGAIAHTIRATGKCIVSAIGAAAVNQAIKGIVSTRFYLEESGADVEVSASTNRDVGPNAIDMVVTRRATRVALPEGTDTAFKVGSATQAAKLGGALASNAREGKGTEAEPICCVGIGANAVLAMVKAAAFASLYVAEEGLVVSMVPEKVVVPMTVDGESVERTALRVAVIARKA